MVTDKTQKQSVVQRCFVKKKFLELSQNSQESACARVFFNKVAGVKPAQVFSCEFCEISKNTFFIENLRWQLLKTKQTLHCRNCC